MGKYEKEVRDYIKCLSSLEKWIKLNLYRWKVKYNDWKLNVEKWIK